MVIFFFTLCGQNNFILTFGGRDVSKTIKLKKEDLKNALIDFKFKEKNFIRSRIISFTIKIPGVKAEIIKGNRIDERIYNKIIRISSRGDIIVISNIKTVTIKDELVPYPDPMSPIVIEIY